MLWLVHTADAMRQDSLVWFPIVSTTPTQQDSLVSSASAVWTSHYSVNSDLSLHALTLTIFWIYCVRRFSGFVYFFIIFLSFRVFAMLVWPWTWPRAWRSCWTFT